MGEERREGPRRCLAGAGDCWGWELPPLSWENCSRQFPNGIQSKTLPGSESIQQGSSWSLCVFRGLRHRTGQQLGLQMDSSAPHADTQKTGEV